MPILTVGKYETPVRAYIGRFNFKCADQGKIVGQLSGGERGRLHLAQTLISRTKAQRTKGVSFAIVLKLKGHELILNQWGQPNQWGQHRNSFPNEKILHNA